VQIVQRRLPVVSEELRERFQGHYTYVPVAGSINKPIKRISPGLSSRLIKG
jgi:hypothetical protein